MAVGSVALARGLCEQAALALLQLPQRQKKNKKQKTKNKKQKTKKKKKKQKTKKKKQKTKNKKKKNEKKCVSATRR